MTAPPVPQRIHDVIRDLTDHGWTFAVEHGEDTAGHAFIRIDAKHPHDPSHPLSTTWHSSETGGRRYRWRTGHIGPQPLTFAGLRDVVSRRGTP